MGTSVTRQSPVGVRVSASLSAFTSQVFVELNELVMDKNQEMQWREMARWIKFEEDVEEETDRWGKPHVASLSFRSLLELRRTISHGERTHTRIHKDLDDHLSTVTQMHDHESRVYVQVSYCWTWTRGRCLASLIKWWNR